MAISLSEANKTTVPVQPPVQKAFKVVLYQVKALYDFNPTEEGEILFKRGQIIDVLDCTTFTDWWRGTLDGQVGIFPSNYVAKIGSAKESAQQRVLPDENAEVLQYMQLVLDLKAAIAKADPLGHDQAENDKLQKDYQKVVELVPIVLKRANAQRKKQDDLAALHERFSTSCATYQGIMNSYMVQRYATTPHYQQGPQQPPSGPQQYAQNISQQGQQQPPSGPQQYAQNISQQGQQQPPSGPQQYAQNISQQGQYVPPPQYGQHPQHSQQSQQYN
jgi:signal transducing adaptor molecule